MKNPILISQITIDQKEYYAYPKALHDDYPYLFHRIYFQGLENITKAEEKIYNKYRTKAYKQYKAHKVKRFIKDLAPALCLVIAFYFMTLFLLSLFPETPKVYINNNN